jgi:hypothetical protein
MIRITLADGRWMDLRPMYISDRLALVDLNEQFKSEGNILEYLQSLGGIVAAALDSKSWKGALLEMSDADLMQVFSDWVKGTEEAAVPLASGATSPTPSPESSSAEPTASPSA